MPFLRCYLASKIQLSIWKVMFISKYSFILMQPSVNHNMYKKSFIENAGFQLHKLGMVHIPCYSNNQWVLVVVNFLTNTFDILDSDKAPQNTNLIAQAVISTFRVFFTNAFPRFNRFDISDFPIRFIPVPKHNFRYDSGVFVLQFIQTFTGSNVANFSNSDVITIRAKLLFQLLTSKCSELHSDLVHNFLAQHGIST